MTTPSTDEQTQKSIAYYSAAVTAWFTTSLERDKSLLTLSAGGIGLHLTLLTTVGLQSSEALVLYIGAITCFAVCMLTILLVFRLNQTHIEDITLNRIKGTDPVLGLVDKFAFISFAFGVVFTAVVAVGAAINSYSKENHMSDKQQNNTNERTLDSVNGAARIQPGGSGIVGNSFNGAAVMQPTTSQSTAQPTTAQTQATTVPTSSQSQSPSQPNGSQ